MANILRTIIENDKGELRKLEKKEFYLVYQQGVMFIALKHF